MTDSEFSEQLKIEQTSSFAIRTISYLATCLSPMLQLIEIRAKFIRKMHYMQYV